MLRRLPVRGRDARGPRVGAPGSGVRQRVYACLCFQVVDEPGERIEADDAWRVGDEVRQGVDVVVVALPVAVVDQYSTPPTSMSAAAMMRSTSAMTSGGGV